MTGRVDNPTLSLPEKVRALLTSFIGIFKGSLAQAPSNAMKFATKVPSTSVSNTYAWLGQSSVFREWVGPRVAQSVAKFAYMITNKTFEMTQVVPKEAIEDDEVGIYSPLVADMAESAMRHVDEQIFGALKNGATGLCYDGLPFFSEVHPREFDEQGVAVVGSPTFSNFLAAEAGAEGPAWIVACTARQIKPVIYQERKAPVFVAKTLLTDESVFNNNEFKFGADKRDAVGYTLPQLAVMSDLPLTADNFAAAVALIEGAVGDKNKPLGLTVTDLIVPTTLRTAAMNILATDTVGKNGAQTNIWKNYAALTVTPYMN